MALQVLHHIGKAAGGHLLTINRHRSLVPMPFLIMVLLRRSSSLFVVPMKSAFSAMGCRTAKLIE